MKRLAIVAAISLALAGCGGNKIPKNAYPIGTACADVEVTDYTYIPIFHNNGKTTWIQYVPIASGSHTEHRCSTIYITPIGD